VTSGLPDRDKLVFRRYLLRCITGRLALGLCGAVVLSTGGFVGGEGAGVASRGIWSCRDSDRADSRA